MADDPGSSAKELDYKDLLAILQPKGLNSIFREFKELSDAPDDLRCLLLVAANLRRTFKALPEWRGIPPFIGLPRLASFLVIKARKVQKVFGNVVNSPNRNKQPGRKRPRPNPRWGSIGVRPLYAMLCDTHPDVDLQVPYGALQLQILHARWAEIQKVLTSRASQTTQVGVQPAAKSGARIARLPGGYACAIRDLSSPTFAELLRYLGPEQLPEAFCRAPRDENEFPLGQGFSDHFTRIMNYCDPRCGPREGMSHVSGTRQPRRPSYPEYVDYGSIRFGLKIISGVEEEAAGTVTQEVVNERSISEEDALELGLDPQEVGQGNLEILTEVPNATSPEETLQTARAKARSFEIDKSIFGWNSQALRIAELENNLFHALRQACDNPLISDADLTAATVVAASIDTGRDMDRLLELKIERLPSSELAFQPPTQKGPNDYWYWSGIGPKYKSELSVPHDMEAQRTNYLRYRSAPLVTELIVKFRKRFKIRLGYAFRAKETEAWVKDWVKRIDSEQRITLSRLSHLRWNELYRITGGERAIACLVIGILQTPASVELHYAVLGSRKGVELFEESSRRI